MCAYMIERCKIHFLSPYVVLWLQSKLSEDVHQYWQMNNNIEMLMAFRS